VSLTGETEPDPFLDVTLGGEYTLVRLIGQGGMGKVYEARRTGSLGQRRAIKVFQEGDPARFNREAEVAIQRDHPNIVRVDDVKVDVATKVTYMVMELLKGDSLRGRLEKVKRLTLQQTLDILLPVMDALAVVHENGVVHRDLTPANIFLHRFSDKGDQEVPKLLDFGLAKVVRAPSGTKAPRTGSQVFMGTPGYAAPVLSSTADARADQFSLGVILYECVVGTNPLMPVDDEASTETELANYFSRAARADVYLSDADAPVPFEFFEVVRKMVSFSQKLQYPGVREAARALAEVTGRNAGQSFVQNPQREGEPSTTVKTGLGQSEVHPLAATTPAAQLLISEPSVPPRVISSPSATFSSAPAQGGKWPMNAVAWTVPMLLGGAAFSWWVVDTSEGSEASASPSVTASVSNAPKRGVVDLASPGSPEPSVGTTPTATGPGVALEKAAVTEHASERKTATGKRGRVDSAQSSSASPPASSSTSSALEGAFEQVEKEAKRNRDAKRRSAE
jgi:serine/threonine protein kinase